MTKASDLPEPRWWSLAREFKAAGWTNKDIGRVLGVRSDNAVRRALNPDAELRPRAAYPSKQDPDRDTRRMVNRAKTRRIWRDRGCQEDLYQLYRDNNCL